MSSPTVGGTRPAGDGPPKAPSVTLERRVSYCERLACYIYTYRMSVKRVGGFSASQRVTTPKPTGRRVACGRETDEGRNHRSPQDLPCHNQDVASSLAARCFNQVGDIDLQTSASCLIRFHGACPAPWPWPLAVGPHQSIGMPHYVIDARLTPTLAR